MHICLLDDVFVNLTKDESSDKDFYKMSNGMSYLFKNKLCDCIYAARAP